MKILILIVVLLLVSCATTNYPVNYAPAVMPKNESKDEKLKFVPYDSPPTPITQIRSKYPKIPHAKRVEATVLVQAYISENGIVTESYIVKRAPIPELDQSAINAIMRTKFKPAQRGGKPVGIWIRIPINFKLNRH